MTTPTFSPPQGIAFEYSEDHAYVVDPLSVRKGYDVRRALLPRKITTATLQWEGLRPAGREYVESFFDQFGGTGGPFFWEPPTRQPAPSGVLPKLSQVTGGALGGATYFLAFTWYHSVNGETTESQEASLAVSANSFLRLVTPPIPARAEGFRVYAGTASGSRTLQATVLNTRTWTQSGALVAGAAAPIVNTLTGPMKWLLDGTVNPVLRRPDRWRLTLRFLEQII